eukprot:Rhum_TRINITY_DN14412_c4_g2::Rhum_TRINITY_DN14412_c4_g2_i1::g.87767::m.87767
MRAPGDCSVCAGARAPPPSSLLRLLVLCVAWAASGAHASGSVWWAYYPSSANDSFVSGNATCDGPQKIEWARHKDCFRADELRHDDPLRTASLALGSGKLGARRGSDFRVACVDPAGRDAQNYNSDDDLVEVSFFASDDGSCEGPAHVVSLSRQRECGGGDVTIDGVDKARSPLGWDRRLLFLNAEFHCSRCRWVFYKEAAPPYFLQGAGIVVFLLVCIVINYSLQDKFDKWVKTLPAKRRRFLESIGRLSPGDSHTYLVKVREPCGEFARLLRSAGGAGAGSPGGPADSLADSHHTHHPRPRRRRGSSAVGVGTLGSSLLAPHHHQRRRRHRRRRRQQKPRALLARRDGSRRGCRRPTASGIVVTVALVRGRSQSGESPTTAAAAANRTSPCLAPSALPAVCEAECDAVHSQKVQPAHVARVLSHMCGAVAQTTAVRCERSCFFCSCVRVCVRGLRPPVFALFLLPLPQSSLFFFCAESTTIVLENLSQKKQQRNHEERFVYVHAVKLLRTKKQS